LAEEDGIYFFDFFEFSFGEHWEWGNEFFDVFCWLLVVVGCCWLLLVVLVVLGCCWLLFVVC